ncbi:ABC transporter ATP-binding protein [Geodermatophilus ruber]|uniref:Branched-chain amino acid transport system ATP-binding protein n=1 Tax=Geodermatophilus ruber TaxID=504800 RepID=A0A1I4BZG7_9ACTN|nr:ABC transporter ATP-binding protein [Geodermatophilus ruber]SFK73577.1 branched-chain amino acid transport system ATP-binding protein [Geodermatophilus ruber]
MSEPVLEVADLRASYGTVEALHGISLTVGEAEVVALVGPNGAGKTTLLRAICGDVRVRGSVVYRGMETAGKKPYAIARLGVGHVPEGRGTFTDLTVAENLQLACLGAGDRARGNRPTPDEAYEMFPILREFRQRPAGALSGGQQQMLAICRALLARPDLLLIDEPSAGLAPLVTKEVFDELERLLAERRISVVLSEQNLTRAFAIAHRGYVLSSGRVVLSGSVSELQQRDELLHAYLGATTASHGGELR